MNLKEFLLMLFDKQIDRYPIIRESFLRSLDTNTLLSALAITNYHCTINELRKYIAHDCIDKGIRVLSMCNIPKFNSTNYSVDILLDKSYSVSDIIGTIILQFGHWISSIHDNLSSTITLFSITASNSEFTFSMIISAHVTGIFGVGGGSMSVVSEIRSRVNTSAVIENPTRLYPNDDIIVPMSDEDLMITNEEVTEFCNIITMPLQEVTALFMDEFNSNNSYCYSYEDVLNGEC
jgi:hypothetical protein